MSKGKYQYPPLCQNNILYILHVLNIFHIALLLNIFLLFSDAHCFSEMHVLSIDFIVISDNVNCIMRILHSLFKFVCSKLNAHW